MISTVQASAGQRLLLTSVDWDTYRRLLRAFDERPGLRLTYDGGALEIMTLTHEHESFLPPICCPSSPCGTKWMRTR